MTANVIAPGDIQTPRFLASRVVDEEMQQEGGTLVRYGQSIEIARAVEFLVSENNTYITGQVLRVDGGKQMAFVAHRFRREQVELRGLPKLNNVFMSVWQKDHPQ